MEKSVAKIHRLLNQIHKIKDSDLQEVLDMALGQVHYIHPLKGATQGRLNTLGDHNIRVLKALLILKTIIPAPDSSHLLSIDAKTGRKDKKGKELNLFDIVQIQAYGRKCYGEIVLIGTDLYILNNKDKFGNTKGFQFFLKPKDERCIFAGSRFTHPELIEKIYDKEAK